MPSKAKSGKAQVKVKDMKAKKNPKGGLNFTRSRPNAVKVPDASSKIIAI